ASMSTRRAEAVETVTQGGGGRAISLAGVDGPMTWQEVRERLEAVRADPQAALRLTTQLRAAGEEPFELEPDMPEGHRLGAADMSNVKMPALDTLRHDAPFFRALKPDKAPILDGLLDGLSEYYRRT